MAPSVSISWAFIHGVEFSLPPYFFIYTFIASYRLDHWLLVYRFLSILTVFMVCLFSLLQIRQQVPLLVGSVSFWHNSSSLTHFIIISCAASCPSSVLDLAALTLKSVISSKCPGSTYWRTVFRNRCLGTGSAHHLGVVCCPRPSPQTELEETCSTYIHKHICVTVCTRTYLFFWSIYR